jgi:hypothetical protein
MVASGHHLVGAADTHEKEFSMKPIKPVTTPRITPVTAASLKQVVGGLRGRIPPPAPGPCDRLDSGTKCPPWAA